MMVDDLFNLSLLFEDIALNSEEVDFLISIIEKSLGKIEKKYPELKKQIEQFNKNKSNNGITEILNWMSEEKNSDIFRDFQRELTRNDDLIERIQNFLVDKLLSK